MLRLRLCGQSRLWQRLGRRPSPGRRVDERGRHGGRRVLVSGLAQGLERLPDLLGEQLRLFPGGEVAAPGGLVEVNEVGVDLLGPAARSLVDLPGEDGEAD